MIPRSSVTRAVFRAVDSLRTRTLEPGFGGIRFGVSEIISELVGSLFYFLKETFDGVPISVFFVSKSEIVSVEYIFQPGSGIDENHGIVDIVFLEAFGADDRGNTFVPRRKQPDMGELVRFGIDSSVQPVALIVERDVIRPGTVCGCKSAFWIQL